MRRPAWRGGKRDTDQISRRHPQRISGSAQRRDHGLLPGGKLCAGDHGAHVNGTAAENSLVVPTGTTRRRRQLVGSQSAPEREIAPREGRDSGGEKKPDPPNQQDEKTPHEKKTRHFFCNMRAFF